MGKFGDSKAARLLRKLEVDSEPGLTNAQLFLTNNDLKPVEEARRKWGNWNFVGAFGPTAPHAVPGSYFG
jgi:NCS1 family nucleobase:cation symporter-1